MILKNLIGTAAFVALMFIVSAFVYKNKAGKSYQNLSSKNNGFAVLELFTSEGCSSCPPADALMGQIAKKYKDKPVYILSYHVDYWNKLGWKDRFSSAENSQRQQDYSHKLSSQVYTPQLVVNGKSEFVGSDKNAVENAISSALFSSEGIRLDLKAEIISKEITFDYKISELNSKNKLLITFIEKNSSTNIGGGENEGRHLQHWQIVQKQYPVSLNSTEETVKFPLPNNFNTNDWEVIGLVQNTKSGEIVSSTKAVF
ncbi:hypothetical protein SAMN05421664_3179 [Chryseobacterium soldanellicola]|uniref:DUF1223 domain-containing protein n=1 Tax=Chryseobacterium soldanellicola TaxID=311333 RepID=A0A1H1FPV9_9FLAO|nr:DUF1223 domain-containing protein [Chryseobacterium soldanellicola]SDR02778.1 hypothetical protein SAMN05421664_3179 [Chryseobacterium soldanellicola]